MPPGPSSSMTGCARIRSAGSVPAPAQARATGASAMSAAAPKFTVPSTSATSPRPADPSVHSRTLPRSQPTTSDAAEPSMALVYPRATAGLAALACAGGPDPSARAARRSGGALQRVAAPGLPGLAQARLEVGHLLGGRLPPVVAVDLVDDVADQALER